ncbi:MAG TPA: S1C family serine protease [Solirubrobacteraceae bacterium]
MQSSLLRALAPAILACALAAAPAAAEPSWAPASSAAIHPGVQTFTDGAQCTANFVFYDASNVYIGQAAHCSGTGGPTDTDGCDSGSLPLGTPVDIGGSKPGTLAYNSWLTMQSTGETDANTCAFNDLALVKVDPADVGKVNPSIPFWGGPTGVDADGTAVGDTVLSYGNSELRGGVSTLSPKEGKSVGDDGDGWSHTVYTATPGIPGDSGSAFLNADGQALGVLSTVAIAPLAASNGVGDVAKELGYLNSAGGFSVTLAGGTEPFRGPLLPL